MKTILAFLPDLKRKSTCEYAGPCPWCGGIDRFIVWPNQGKGGRFLCRQCQKNGDAIDYLKAEGLSFKQALMAIGLDSHDHHQRTVNLWALDVLDVDASCRPKNGRDISEVWINAATEFVKRSQASTDTNSHAEWLQTLKSKHLTVETAMKFGITWNPKDQFIPCQAWGIDGGKIRLPRGLIIPIGRARGIVGIKIRRADTGNGPRYWQVKGSGPDCLYLGEGGLPVVIVESDLDAYLIWQEAGSRVGVVSLGGASKLPDSEAMSFLRQAPRILIATDFDEQSSDKPGAGQLAYHRLSERFPEAEYFPPAIGKDPCDMQTLGVSVNVWLDCAIGQEAELLE